MGKRAHGTFYNFENYQFEIELHKSGFAGTSHEITLAADGLALTWDASTTDLHDEIVSSAATLSVVFSGSVADDNLLDEIRTADEGDFRLLVRRNYTVGGGTLYNYWHGIMLAEIAVVDELPQRVELSFTDDLALLDEVLYKFNDATEYNDQQPLPVMLVRCLSKLRWWSDVFDDGTTTPLKISEYIGHDDITGTPTADNIICNHVKLRNKDNDGVSQYHSAGDVLRLVLRCMQSRICLFDGVFWVRPLGGMDTSTTFFDNYTNTGALDTSPTLTSNIEFATATNYQTNAVVATTPSILLQGVQTGLLPPLSVVMAKHRHSYLPFDWWGTSATSGGTSNFYAANAYGASTTIDPGEVVTLTFGYTFSVDGDTLSDGSGGTAEGARAKLRFRLRHGTQYANRSAQIIVDSQSNAVQSAYNAGGYTVDCFQVGDGAAAYSTNTGNHIEVWSAVYYRAAGLVYGNGVESITFPPLPSPSGDTEIETPTVVLYGEDGTVYSETATVTINYMYQMHGAAVQSGEFIQYRRINDLGSAREKLDLGEIILGDRVSQIGTPNVGNWAINIAGSGFTASTPDWYNGKFSSASQPIVSLQCWDRMAMRMEACKTAMATIRHPYVSPMRALLLTIEGSSERYVPQTLRYNAAADLWDVEAIEYKYNSSDTPTAEQSEPAVFGGMGYGGRDEVLTPSIFTGVVERVQTVDRDVRQLWSVQADTAETVNNRFIALALDDLSDVATASGLAGHVVKYDGATFRNAFLSLSELSNVVLTNPANGETLQYNGTNWVNQSGGGGATSFADLDDVNPNLSPAGGHLLIWTTASGGQWSSTTPELAIGSAINAGDLGNITETASGTAGHVLLDYALGGSAYWISTALSTATNSHVDLANIKNVAATAPTTGDLLRWNGTAWEPAAAFSYATLQSSFYTSDGNGDYIPFGGTLAETTSSQYYNRYTAPLSGEIVEARIFTTTSSAGSCTLAFSKYPIPQTVATATGTISAANTAVQFSFGGNATFSAGDQLRLWFDPTGAPGGVSVSILLKFNH